ncbi:hypothetical protein GCM10023221_07350 [Luteimicrobium xylanilyticum]|uniref:Uncharacterized protein n=1 Tax=Luteimicrobium xylanilyticum TaxID=1133546 RepID=A0A5P9QAX9_9MICO|nr:hypothetical protein [Luteimicrobium xylanilyticum]QFU98280.1 hypothetical protein KDY119_01792 [Luteimicrobium xylanilyticum]
MTVWTLVWWVLALGAVATFALVGLRLWRSGKALFAELSAAGRAFEDLSRSIDAAVAAQQAAQTGIRPTLFDDPAEHRARLLTLRLEREDRKARRKASHRATYERWDEFNR